LPQSLHGFAIPYGSASCAGPSGTDWRPQCDDSMRLAWCVTRCSSRSTRTSSTNWPATDEQRATSRHLRALYEHELDHLHLLEERYTCTWTARVDWRRTRTPPANWLFREINSPTTRASALYEAAISMERRTRDHFLNARRNCRMARKGLCLELARKKRRCAMLETEQAQFLA